MKKFLDFFLGVFDNDSDNIPCGIIYDQNIYTKETDVKWSKKMEFNFVSFFRTNHPNDSEEVILPTSFDSIEDFKKRAIHMYNLMEYMNLNYEKFDTEDKVNELIEEYKKYLYAYSIYFKENNTYLYPPSKEIHLIQISHVIRTRSYNNDCYKNFKVFLPTEINPEYDEEVYQSKTEETKNIINDLLSDFDNNDDKSGNNNEEDDNNLLDISLKASDIIKDQNWFKYLISQDLRASDTDFYDITKNDELLTKTLKNYERFLYLTYKYGGPIKKIEIATSFQIDLFWHTHMCNTSIYMNDCKEYYFGDKLEHQPWVNRSEEQECSLKQATKDYLQTEFNIDKF
eukprot:TRINITY_DN7208_c0_g1_i1.p1 TRINITY_DN7208_c0_g1~~TRINITY_DN7208_c0_g1_i1.p1  ORF type:complete len:342 (-),score=74.41 TRINITY_DN7208_c0_g1_i1:29-1054(-)